MAVWPQPLLGRLVLESALVDWRRAGCAGGKEGESTAHWREVFAMVLRVGYGRRCWWKIGRRWVGSCESRAAAGGEFTVGRSETTKERRGDARVGAAAGCEGATHEGERRKNFDGSQKKLRSAGQVHNGRTQQWNASREGTE